MTSSGASDLIEREPTQSHLPSSDPSDELPPPDRQHGSHRSLTREQSAKITKMPSRSQHFGLRPPLADHSHLKLHHAEGPFANFNPTRAHFTVSTPASSTAEETDETPKDEISTDKKKQTSPHPGIQFLWRSRDNRKGRHRLLIDLSKHHDTKPPRASKHPKSVFQTTLRTFTYFPVWDISWLVAFIFTMGSVVWVINVRLNFIGIEHSQLTGITRAFFLGFH